MDDDYAARLGAKLAPEGMRETLVRAGCFLSAYELIKIQVVDGVRDFFWDRSDYDRDVASCGKNRFRASVGWLVDNKALTTEQGAVLEDVYQHRQEVAHELPKLLIDPDFEVNTRLLIDAAVCLRALGIFWGRISVDADPQWDGQDVADDDIRSVPDLLMGSLIELAGLVSDDPAVPAAEHPR